MNGVMMIVVQALIQTAKPIEEMRDFLSLKRKT